MLGVTGMAGRFRSAGQFVDGGSDAQCPHTEDDSPGGMVLRRLAPRLLRRRFHRATGRVDSVAGNGAPEHLRRTGSVSPLAPPPTDGRPGTPRGSVHFPTAPA